MLLLKNNAMARLISPLTSSSTSLTVETGGGDRFPETVTIPGSVFEATIFGPDGTNEIVTAQRNPGSDSFTITRGSGARAWATEGVVVGNFITANLLAPLSIFSGANTEAAIRAAILAATTGNVTQTFQGATAFVNTVTLSGNVNFTSTTGTVNIGTNATTGVVTIGGLTQTGLLTFGRSTQSSIVNVASGTTVSGATKTVNIGTGGAVGSFSNINVGTISGGLISLNSPKTFLRKLIAESGSETSPSMSFSTDEDTGIYLRSPNVIGFSTFGTTKMILDDDGWLLIGTTSGTYTNSGSFIFRPGIGQELGKLIINHSTTNSVNSSYLEFAYNGAIIGRVAQNGTSLTQYITSSDYRLKKEVKPIDDAITRIMSIKPCKYKWKENDADGEGFIAHELQEHFPNAVNGSKDAIDENGNPIYQGVDSSFLVPALVSIVQNIEHRLRKIGA